MDIKKVLLVVAHKGYQPIEYGEPKRLFNGAEFDVVTASDQSGAAIGNDGSFADVQLTTGEVAVSDYEGIIFIGGPGALEHLDNETSYSIIRSAADKKIPLGAICVSPRILARAGVLENKRATGWDGDGELGAIFQEHGVIYAKNDVVVDGRIVTASGPQVAEEFGRQMLVLMQKGKE